MITNNAGSGMIIKDPDPRLRQECTFVVGKKFRSVSDRLLKEIAIAYEAEKKNHNIVVGLAAPQIGQTVRAFTAFGGVFINPVIVEQSKRLVDSKEGCLSLPPDLYTDRKRHQSVTMIWSNPARQVQKRVFTDDMAVIVQHECDHLEGKMCNETSL